MLYRKFVLCLVVIALMTTNVFADRNLFQGIGDTVEVGNTKLVVNYVAYTNKINNFSIENSAFAIINFDVYIKINNDLSYAANNFYLNQSNSYVFAKQNNIKSNEWVNVEIIVTSKFEMKNIIMIDPTTGKEIIIELRETEKVVI